MHHEQFYTLLQKAWKHHQAGRTRDAEKQYRKLLGINPGQPDTNNLLGLLYIQTGRPEAAIRHIQKALLTDSNNAQSFYNLGIAYKDLKQPARATDHFRKTVALAPGNVDAINSLANILRLQGKRDEATKWFKRALKLQPEHPLVQCNLGHLRLEQGELQQAEIHFQRALSKAPGLPEATKGLSETQLQMGLDCEQHGKLEDAVTHYRKSIKLQPGFSSAHFFLAQLRTHTSSQAECVAMETLYRDKKLPDSDRIKLAFGLGFALESRKDYAHAFEYMRKGHRLQKKADRFSLDDETQRFNTTIHVFDQALAQKLAGIGNPDERPVFIVGMPRSGTSLAEQILASHSSVHGNGESTLVAQSANRLVKNFRQASASDLLKIEAGQWQAEARLILEGLSEQAGGAKRITDTSPMNFLYIGAITTLFPSARIVVCLRDPIDNCMSIYRQYLTGRHAYAHELSDLGAFYRLHERLLDHWQHVYPGKIHLLNYDRLVIGPELEIRNLLDFCRLPFEQQCLDFHESKRPVTSPSASQVHQPIYSTSVGAWKRYQKELEPLVQMFGDG